MIKGDGMLYGEKAHDVYRRLYCRPELFRDLQLFAAEDEGRTEDPTGKRISKARDDGQVAKSIDLVQVVNLFACTLVVLLTFPRIVGYEMNQLKYYFENMGAPQLTQESLGTHFMQIGLHIVMVTWPILLVSVAVTIIANVAQVGWLFTLKPLQFKFNRLIPQPGKLIQRLIIGKTVAFNLFKSLMKLLGCGVIAYLVIADELDILMALWRMQPFQATEQTLDVAYELVWKICLLLLLPLAIGDYAYQRHEWKDQLKMRRQEVKDEQKQAEGDPDIKRAQRKRMMEVARRRMMQEIPTADVVITNPTHYAVAIKYDQAVDDAPRVVAKGEGFLALKIRQIAEQNGVPLFEDKPLAQALFKGVEIGDRIPPQFFQAVARVLAFVYKSKKKAS